MVVGNTQNDFGGRVWRGLEAADERPGFVCGTDGVRVWALRINDKAASCRTGCKCGADRIVAISVELHLPPPVSGDLLRMCGITLDFNNQKNTVYQMILTEYYKEGIEQVNVCLAACGCAPLKTAC